MIVKRSLSAVSIFFVVSGALLMGSTLLYGGFAWYQQHQIASGSLNAMLQEPIRTVSASSLTVRSAPAERISIPSIDVDAPVVEVGTLINQQGELVWETPKHAVGHHQNTSDPGDTGNVVLSGHISSPIKQEGNVFSRLPDMQLGAQVVLQTREGTFTYAIVSRRIVEPAQIEVMDQTAEPTLTLITCYPDFVYTHRLVLLGKLVDFRPSTEQVS